MAYVCSLQRQAEYQKAVREAQVKRASEEMFRPSGEIEAEMDAHREKHVKAKRNARTLEHMIEQLLWKNDTLKEKEFQAGAEVAKWASCCLREAQRGRFKCYVDFGLSDQAQLILQARGLDYRPINEDERENDPEREYFENHALTWDEPGGVRSFSQLLYEVATTMSEARQHAWRTKMEKDLQKAKATIVQATESGQTSCRIPLSTYKLKTFLERLGPFKVQEVKEKQPGSLFANVFIELKWEEGFVWQDVVIPRDFQFE